MMIRGAIAIHGIRLRDSGMVRMPFIFSRIHRGAEECRCRYIFVQADVFIIVAGEQAYRK